MDKETGVQPCNRIASPHRRWHPRGSKTRKMTALQRCVNRLHSACYDAITLEGDRSVHWQGTLTVVYSYFVFISVVYSNSGH